MIVKKYKPDVVVIPSRISSFVRDLLKDQKPQIDTLPSSCFELLSSYRKAESVLVNDVDNATSANEADSSCVATLIDKVCFIGCTFHCLRTHWAIIT